MNTDALNTVVRSYLGNKFDPLVAGALAILIEGGEVAHKSIMESCRLSRSHAAVAEVVQAVMRSDPTNAATFATEVFKIFGRDYPAFSQELAFGGALGLFKGAASIPGTAVEFHASFAKMVKEFLFSYHPLLRSGIDSKYASQLEAAVKEYASGQIQQAQGVLDEVARVLDETSDHFPVVGIYKVILDALVFARLAELTTSKRVRLVARHPKLFYFSLAGGRKFAVIETTAQGAQVGLVKEFERKGEDLNLLDGGGEAGSAGWDGLNRGMVVELKQ